MKLFAGTVLTIMLFAGSAFADLESFGKLNPQVILLSNPPVKCAWHPGITLANLLVKIGGTSQSYVFIVRNGVAEKLSSRRISTVSWSRGTS